MTTGSAVDNLLDAGLYPAEKGAPHALFDACRAETPGHWNPPSPDYEVTLPGSSMTKGFWVLTRYQDVVDASKDQERFSSHEGGSVIWDLNDDMLMRERASFMNFLPTPHAAIKRVIRPAFAANAIRSLGPDIERLAVELVDAVTARGECEFVFDVASKLPVYVFCELMGIPEVIRAEVVDLGNAIADVETTANRSMDPTLRLFAIAEELSEARRRQPDGSLMSLLVHDTTLGLEQININMLFDVIAIAGHETTRSTAAHSMSLMQAYPGQYRLLLSDITRANARKHIAFRTGPHVCIGAQLARLELKALLSFVCISCFTLVVIPATQGASHFQGRTIMDTSSLFRLDGRVALVTGGSRGIGKMIAAGFIAQGAKVYISSRKAPACLETAAELGPNCIPLPQDVSTVAGCRALAAQLAAHESQLDILVNNAGAAWGAPFTDFPESGWDKVMDLNVKSPFFLTQALHALLKASGRREQPAKVINITSIDGMRLNPQETYSYHASKSALIYLTKRMAAQLIKDAINVTSIAPGAFASEMNRVARDHGEAVAKAIPAKRIGVDEDMAGAAIYLASRAGDYVVGDTITVDGGVAHASLGLGFDG